MHYRRLLRKGDLGGATPLREARRVVQGTDRERFDQSYVVDPDGCWHWAGAPTTGGYPEFTVDGRTVYAHRWSHAEFVGPLVEGLVIDHTCHNADPECPGGPCRHRSCVNPAHLEQTTHGVNISRGRRRRAA